MNLIRKERPFYKINENNLIISRFLTKEIIDNEDFNNTVLDSRLKNENGFIKLKEGMFLYNFFRVKKLDKFLPMYNINPKLLVRKFNGFIYQVNKNEYLMLPKGLNNIFKLNNGLKILTGLQKAYNNIIIENNKIRKKDNNMYYQNLYTNLLSEYNSLLSGKGQLFDRACNSMWPFSLRTTIVPGPNLKINEISLPYRTLLNWVNQSNLRQAFNIPEDLPNKEAVKFLDGKRVIVLRQPCHDRSSLMSFIIKLKYNNS